MVILLLLVVGRTDSSSRRGKGWGRKGFESEKERCPTRDWVVLKDFPSRVCKEPICNCWIYLLSCHSVQRSKSGTRKPTLKSSILFTILPPSVFSMDFQVGYLNNRLKNIPMNYENATASTLQSLVPQATLKVPFYSHFSTNGVYLWH